MPVQERPETILIHGEPYYTSRKAREVLGMTATWLKNQVMRGNIKSETPKSGRSVYYRAEDVKQISRVLEMIFSFSGEYTRFESITTWEEMEECQKISQALFGISREIIDAMKILEKNPETYYTLKDNDQIIGYTGIKPLKPGKLNSILAQTLPVKILPEDIETFEKEENIDLYISINRHKAEFSSGRTTLLWSQADIKSETSHRKSGRKRHSDWNHRRQK
jgi:hypothetical protein